jgi:Tol biopolymer transport system component
MDALSRNPRTVTGLIATGQRRRPSRRYQPSLGAGFGGEPIEQRTLLSVGLVSLNAPGTASGDGASLFSDTATAPVPSTAGQTSPSLSADGKLVVFESSATNLVGGVNDTNNATDVFVRNLQTGQTTLVSATPSGTVGNGRSFNPVISPDGRYVAFLSTATNLSSVAANAPSANADTPQTLLYVRDLQTGTTTLLDATPDGHASNGFSTGDFVFSPQSNSLAFTDSSTNLTSTPTSASATMENVYLRNLAAGTTTAVSVTPSGTLSQGNAGQGAGAMPSNLVFSPDGSKLAFASTATDLTSNPLDNSPAANPFGISAPPQNLFVRDLNAGTTTLVSATPADAYGNGSSTRPMFSPDSSQLAFLSTSTNLTSQAPSGSQSAPLTGLSGNLFLRNLATGTTTAVTVTPGNKLSSGFTLQMAFSPDGSKLAFASTGTDLTSIPIDPAPAPAPPGGDAALGLSNVYVHDIAAGTTTPVSLTPSGDLANGFSINPTFSPDGQSLAYVSNATDLTANPAPPPQVAPTGSGPGSPMPGTTPADNLFLTNLATKSTAPVSITPTGNLSAGNVTSFAFSPDSKQLAFDALATDLTSNPPPPPDASGAPTVSDSIFVRDLAAQTTSLITAMPGGTLANNPSFAFSQLFFTPDSQTLLFNSGGALASNDTNGASDIYSATMPFAPPGAIHFSTWQYDAGESSGQAVITVVRDGPLDSAASVNYSVQDGTAKAGIDFQGASGTLNFSPGQASATFPITLDTAASFAELKTATLTLSNPSGAPLGYPTATLYLSGIMPTTPRPITTPFWAAPPQTPSVTSFQTSQLTTFQTPPTTSNSTGIGMSSSHTQTSTATNGSSSIVNGLSATSSTVSALAVSTKVGPAVTRVTLQTARHKITGLVIHFNKPLAGTGAGNPANYSVNLMTVARHVQRGVRQFKTGRAVGITATAYDSTSQTVTLVFAAPLSARQVFQLRVNGGSGGITDTSGNALNSSSSGEAGSNTTYIANQ